MEPCLTIRGDSFIYKLRPIVFSFQSLIDNYDVGSKSDLQSWKKWKVNPMNPDSYLRAETISQLI